MNTGNIQDEQITAVHEEVKRNLDIAAAYLYGSSAEGVANALSDVDIAVVVKEPLTRSEFDIRSDLIMRLGKIFPGRDVDVQLLTTRTGLPFLTQVFRHGKMLVTNDVEYTARFISRMTLMALDFASFSSLATVAMHERLERGDYGRRSIIS